ncbi:hypothetical protein BDZ94DRAFT_1243783 [Collybia nuda]|uniref:Uncharacterized protein n=1 Tax=Collybia nuda TaxID=64659 RepID=A0A9P6CQL1_9AGAR|nr:hypothetical protein BDZ94DRAFT_1243783 [Collybia nuda]
MCKAFRVSSIPSHSTGRRERRRKPRPSRCIPTPRTSKRPRLENRELALYILHHLPISPLPLPLSLSVSVS